MFKTNMFKTKKSLIIIGALVILTIGFFIYSEMNIEKKPWSVIYLTTGEIYVSKISCFPKFQISDNAYILQDVKVPAEEGMEPQTSFQLTPIQEALWAPEKLYVNRRQVVFYGPVKEDSKVGDAIKEAGKW